MARYNWKRSYRIEFGTPEITPANYYQSGSKTPQSITPLEDQSIPSDAIKISNLEADGFPTRGFTFTLNTKRSLGKNSKDKEISTVELYNISPEMRQYLNKPNCIMQISAGYGENVDLIYRGYVTRTTRRTSGTDIIYQIQCKDSWVDVQNTKVTINIAEQYNTKEALQILSSQFPTVSSPIIFSTALESKFSVGGFVYDGKVIEELEKTCKQYKLEYALQNGKLVIVPKNMVQGDADYNNMSNNTYVLTAEVTKSLDPVNDNSKNLTTDNSAKTKRNVVLTTFLIPITFDQFFTIPSSVSEELAGTYKVKTIQYNLQSRGNAWDTVVEGEPL